MQAVLEEWKLPNNMISVVVTDNASSMIKGFKDFAPSAEDFRQTKKGEQEFRVALEDVKSLFGDDVEDNDKDDEVLKQIAEFEAFERSITVRQS